MEQKVSPLIPLGAGIAIGGGALWLLVELFPLIIAGGAAYLVIKGIGQQNTEAEEK